LGDVNIKDEIKIKESFYKNHIDKIEGEHMFLMKTISLLLGNKRLLALKKTISINLSLYTTKRKVMI